MSYLFKGTNGDRPAYNDVNVQFAPNAVTVDPLPWNPKLACEGGLHAFPLAQAAVFLRDYTHVCDVEIPKGEWRFTPGIDRVKAHSMWLSAPRPKAEFLKPYPHDTRIEMITAHPSLLNIRGLVQQVFDDCPQDKLIELVKFHNRFCELASTEAFIKTCPRGILADIIILIPAVLKYVTDFSQLSDGDRIKLLKAGYQVHTMPITEGMRRADVSNIDVQVGIWTLWKNGLSVIKTADGYVGTWTDHQIVPGGFLKDDRCIGCDRCAKHGADGNGVTRPETHRRVDRFRAHDVVTFPQITDGLAEGAFTSTSEDGTVRRGHLVAGVMHGRVDITEGDKISSEMYDLGVLVPDVQKNNSAV